MKNVFLSLCMCVYLSLGLAYAESVRTYSVVVPFSAGGPSDILIRGIVPQLNDGLDKHNIKLIVENRPGAGGSIGLATVMNNDKLMFGFFSSFFAINKTVKNDTSYEFDSVNLLGFAGYNKMVVLSGKYKNLTDLQNHCANDNTITVGTSGVGSTSHLTALYFSKKYLKCDNIINVAYKTVSLAYPDLKSKRLDFMIDFSITADSFIKSNFINHITTIKDNELLAWHILVSNKIDSVDAEIVKREFNLLKKNENFNNMLESMYHIQKFSENKSGDWLRNEFSTYKKMIEELPK